MASKDLPALRQITKRIYKLKIILIGDVCVGKTSLATRFAKDAFDEGSYQPTIGASYINKIVHVNDDIVHFTIWDTAGQERYRSLTPMYIRGAHIAYIVYDVTNPTSFANVPMWLDAVKHHGDTVKFVLVANKCDREVAVKETIALDYAEANSLQYVKTSAKTGFNVEKLFTTLASKIVEEMKIKEKHERLLLSQDRKRDQVIIGTELGLNETRCKQKACCTP